MAVLDEIIKPDPFNDIRDTLNAGGGSVNNEGVTAFLPSANINIFSFYKPHHRPQSFSPSAPYMPDARGGLYLDEIEHVIKWDAPKGGEASPYRWQDFIGYKYKSQPPSVDGTRLTATADRANPNMDVTVEPYWADPKFDWGLVCGGLTFKEMQIAVEVYSQAKNLMGTGKFKVKDIDATGKANFRVTNLTKKDDTKIYVKGFFCDYNGNQLCPIPTTDDGFVEKPLIVTQSRFIYLGEVTMKTAGFSATAQMEDGEPATSGTFIINITNQSGKNYIAATGYPQAYVRWRAYDGSYTSSWMGADNNGFVQCKNIPNNFTRTDRIEGGLPPAQGTVNKWYMDIEIRMS